MTVSCLSLCRTYLLELVHSSLQQVAAGGSHETNTHLPVSVDTMSCIAEEFVTAADMLPTLLVSSDDKTEQLVTCRSVVNVL